MDCICCGFSNDGEDVGFSYNNTDSIKSAHAIWKVHMHKFLSISEIACIFIMNSCKSNSHYPMNKHSKTYWIYIFLNRAIIKIRH
jgi:hypothetical protein